MWVRSKVMWCVSYSCSCSGAARCVGVSTYRCSTLFCSVLLCSVRFMLSVRLGGVDTEEDESVLWVKYLLLNLSTTLIKSAF